MPMIMHCPNLKTTNNIEVGRCGRKGFRPKQPTLIFFSALGSLTGPLQMGGNDQGGKKGGLWGIKVEKEGREEGVEERWCMQEKKKNV